jgi:hypothetical protein
LLTLQTGCNTPNSQQRLFSIKIHFYYITRSLLVDRRTYNFIMLSVLLLLLLGWNPLASAVHHPGDFIHTSRRGQFLKVSGLYKVTAARINSLSLSEAL